MSIPDFTKTDTTTSEAISHHEISHTSIPGESPSQDALSKNASAGINAVEMLRSIEESEDLGRGTKVEIDMPIEAAINQIEMSGGGEESVEETMEE